MKTKICDLFNIKYPIFQGGMAWVSNASLAGAVSNAGGLGIIAAGNAPAEYVKDEIDKIRKITDKPFGVNIMLMSPFADEIAVLVAKEKVPVVTTGAGLPTKYMKKWIESGIKVVPITPSIAIAKMVERAGATAVIAEGGESGGHIGEITTMALVPQICDAVKIPVIAAGGIGDGRGMAAVFMLGAKGVQCGTKFLVAKECTIHQNYKDKVLKSKEIDTMATGRTLGHPVRAIKNKFTRDFLKKEYSGEFTTEQLEEMGAGALRKATVDGNLEEGTFMAGQICSMIKKEQTAKEIIDDLISQTEEILKGVSQWEK